MPKATPRDIIEGLQELLKNAKAGKRNWTQNSDNVHWVTLAKKLISSQAAEIEDLKTQLLGKAETAPTDQQVPDAQQGIDPLPPEVKDNDC